MNGEIVRLFYDARLERAYREGSEWPGASGLTCSIVT